MDQNDPLAPLSKLMTRLAEVMDELGLELQTFAVLPHPEGMDMPNMAQAVFVLDPDKVFKSPEERAQDEQLAQMDRMLHRDRVHDKIEEARLAAIKSLADQMGTTVDGLGLDPDALPEIEVDDFRDEIETDGSVEDEVPEGDVLPPGITVVPDDPDNPDPALDKFKQESDKVGEIDAFDPNLSIEEIMRLMEQNDKGDEPPLAGV